jgi:hypothetical protein
MEIISWMIEGLEAIESSTKCKRGIGKKFWFYLPDFDLLSSCPKWLSWWSLSCIVSTKLCDLGSGVKQGMAFTILFMFGIDPCCKTKE